ncbi:MAG: DUF2207 domain-containing protein, partial [Alphaproteobacteria bacterium]|nr:DUF2207 domain-containing protein [Alphaproteobacteria bacterium]
MQKKILTICFIISLGIIANASASVTSITAQNPVEAMNSYNRLPPNSVNPDNMPDPNNQEEVRAFFKERFEKAARMTPDEPIDLSSPSSIGIMHSPEYYERESEKKKTLFQKMYEKAVASLHETQPDQKEEQIQKEEELERSVTRFFKIIQQDEPMMEEPDVPTVSVPLPSGRRVLAPAQEHIPYLLSYIDIEANGYLKIEDTIIIVANGNKFAHGLQRVFNKYAKKGQKTEFILQSVTVNGTQIPYIAEEIGSQIILKPKHNQKLEPGVYTYKFNYMVNNQLVRLENRNYLFHWNLTGVPLNALITSANTIISIPEGHTFTDMKLYIGEGNLQTIRRTNTYRLAGNVVAFASNTPVLNGEDTLVVGVLDKNIFIKDFDKNLSYFLINWGSILYASLGFLAISLSLLISLITLKKNKSKNKFNPSYNGALMRTVLIGKYDRIAFVSQILDLYRKGCLDIIQEGSRIFLEKQPHFSAKLTKAEKRILSVLFAKKSPRTEINNANNNKFKRAQKILEKSVKKTVNKYRLIH